MLLNDLRVPVKIAQEQRGHASTSTTLNIYTHLVDPRIAKRSRTSNESCLEIGPMPRHPPEACFLGGRLQYSSQQLGLS